MTSFTDYEPLYRQTGFELARKCKLTQLDGRPALFIPLRKGLEWAAEDWYGYPGETAPYLSLIPGYETIYRAVCGYHGIPYTLPSIATDCGEYIILSKEAQS